MLDLPQQKHFTKVSVLPTQAMMNWDKTRVHRPQGNAQVDFEIDLEQPSSSTSLREDAITLLAFLPIM